MSSAAAALASSAADVAGPRVAHFKAPLLSRILEQGDPDRREVVLDLAGASEALLERLSETRRCRIEVADLVGSGGVRALNDMAAMEDPDPSVIHRLLPEPGAEPLNLVLCWDLPNYLTRDALQSLFDVIALRAAPGCRLHMLIAYSRRDMPAAPARYVPAADGQLSQICANAITSAAPRYSPEDLAIVVGRFRYERGVLLANGMQEFVYAWPDTSGARRKRRS